MEANLPVNGSYYERQVPDTLDLAERARLALNGLGGTIDPEMGSIYFFVVYANPKPYMSHHLSDNDIDVKITACFPMMRIMSGERSHMDVEVLHRKSVLSRIDDGFFWSTYDPEKPWKHRDSFYTDNLYKDVRPEDLTCVFTNGRMIRHLIEWREIAGGQECDPLASSLAAGLRKIALFNKDYAYYPDGGWGNAFSYPRKSGWLHTDEPQSEVSGAEGSVVAYYGNEIQGLAKWYAVSGDTQALDLSTRLARFIMRPAFWGGTPHPDQKDPLLNRWADRLPDPVCTPGHELGHWYTHFHARAIGLRGLLELGTVTNDVPILDFVRRSYEYSLTMGIPRLGFIDCTPAISDNMEACALGDLLGMAVRLSDAGVGDYWDDVDACVRNHLAEAQLTDVDHLRQISAASPARGAEDYSWPAYPTLKNQGSWDRVIERSLGLFGSAVWPTAIPEPWIMQCCTGNALNGLYYAWEGALRETATTARVNLLLNRAGKLVDVDSWIPYEGRVEVHNKAAQRVLLRVPGWVRLQDARFQVGGNPWNPDFAGRYAIFDSLRPNTVIRMDFLQPEFETSYTTGFRGQFEAKYQVRFRGSTVIDISNRDTRPTSYQMYRRAHLLEPGPASMRQVTRFVADQAIHNW